VIAGATVVVHADATGQEKTIKTTGDGQYRVQYLVPGVYTVTVNASGFSAKTRSGIQLALSQQIHLDVAMSLSGNAADGGRECDATATAERERYAGDNGGYEPHGEPSAERAQVQRPCGVDSGREGFEPGYHSSSTAGSNDRFEQRAGGLGAVQVDGIVMTNTRSAYVNSYPSVGRDRGVSRANGELLGGVWIFQRGSNINVQLKSGTNQFHGGVFEFIRNDAVDARNYFRVAPLKKNVLKTNQFGATIAGLSFAIRRSSSRATKGCGRMRRFLRSQMC